MDITFYAGFPVSAFDAFSYVLIDMGYDIFDGDISEIVADWCAPRGYDPEAFRVAFLRFVAGV